MNQEIIVDTSALIAFFVKSETNHQIAKQYVSDHFNHRWIILETVFDGLEVEFQVMLLLKLVKF